MTTFQNLLHQLYQIQFPDCGWVQDHTEENRQVRSQGGVVDHEPTTDPNPCMDCLGYTLHPCLGLQSIMRVLQNHTMI